MLRALGLELGQAARQHELRDRVRGGQADRDARALRSSISAEMASESVSSRRAATYRRLPASSVRRRLESAGCVVRRGRAAALMLPRSTAAQKALSSLISGARTGLVTGEA